MVRNAQHDQAVLWLFRLLLRESSFSSVQILLLLLLLSSVGTVSGELGNEFVLDQNESFHRVLQGQLVLSHLTQDGTDVQVDVTRVRDLEAIVDSTNRKVEVIVLDLESFLQIGKRTSQLLGTTENAGEVVVGDSSVTITFFGERLCFAKKFQGNVKVL